MIRVGVIGCGQIAQQRHLPEYRDNPDATIAGLFDLNGERAAALGEAYQTRTFASYAELLRSPDIDAVSVCTANRSHAEITVAALCAGKHVLCEKPMATTLADCERMVKAAGDNGKYLMIGQNQRLTPGHVKGRELIASGAIGRPLTFRTTFGHGGPETWSVDPGKSTWFFDKAQAVMGVLADLGIHKTDLIQDLLGQTVVEVMGRIATLDKRDAKGEFIGVDDNAICIYRMDGGALGTMTASWTHYAREDNGTVIYGTEGELRLYDAPGHPVALLQKGREPVYFDVGEMQTNDNQTCSGVIDLFVASLEKGDYRPLSGESVLTAMRAVFGGIESSLTGRAVAVNG